jgi:hypothetical protein
MVVLTPEASVPTQWEKPGRNFTTVRCWLPELTAEQLESGNARFTLASTEWLWWIRRRLIMLVVFGLVSSSLAIAARYLPR